MGNDLSDSIGDTLKNQCQLVYNCYKQEKKCPCSNCHQNDIDLKILASNPYPILESIDFYKKKNDISDTLIAFEK